MEPLRIETAHRGIRELRKHVDSLLVIKNEKILDLYSDLTFSEAFAKADEVLCTAAKSIAEIITVSGHMNVDFADVRTAMKDSGVALIGIGRCAGQNRAEEAVNQAIISPLLNDNNIRGAKNVLVNIMMGEKELKVSEVKKITEIVLGEVGNVVGQAGSTAKPYIKIGVGKNPQLGEDVTVSIIATGFEVGDLGINDGAPRPPRAVPPAGGKGRPARSVAKPLADPLNPVIAVEEDPDDAGEEEEAERLEGERRYAGGLSPQSAAGVASVRPKIPGPAQSRMPRLLDPEIPDDELDRPARFAKRARLGRAEGEVSHLTYSSGASKWEQTSAAYISGNPD
jgi:hypothetical protein